MAELNVAGHLDAGWKTSKELTKLTGDPVVSHETACTCPAAAAARGLACSVHHCLLLHGCRTCVLFMQVLRYAQAVVEHQQLCKLFCPCSAMQELPTLRPLSE